jgi:putative methionine-R-sulfoxide reductase with GAF domain
MIARDPSRPERDYDAIARALAGISGDREARMRGAADALWEGLAGAGVSWVGFYVGEGERMVLGPCRDGPACSPIGLHGMCGRAWVERTPLVVRDVRTLGEGYIACDPRDLSEVVVPLFEDDGACWGVLDADSFDVGSFETADAMALAELMVVAGLSVHDDEPLVVRTL